MRSLEDIPPCALIKPSTGLPKAHPTHRPSHAPGQTRYYTAFLTKAPRPSPPTWWPRGLFFGFSGESRREKTVKPKADWPIFPVLSAEIAGAEPSIPPAKERFAPTDIDRHRRHEELRR